VVLFLAVIALAGAILQFTGFGRHTYAIGSNVEATHHAGVGAELDVIAAVVIGGASLSGGRGTITGTSVGILLISLLRNGCTLVGISTNAQLIVIGVVIVLAVAVDQFTRHKAGDAV
jgi:ribose/xylose/arabinose/galactoside ABC-type transport system permease subunit